MSTETYSDVIRFDSTDPRRPDLAVKYVVVPSLSQDDGNYAGFISLMLSAFTYLFKTKFYGAIAILLSLSSINSHRAFSASARDSPAPMWSGYSTLIFALTAVFSIYFAPQNGIFNAPKVV